MAAWVPMCIIIIYIYIYIRTYKKLRARTWYYFPSNDWHRVLEAPDRISKDHYGEFAQPSYIDSKEEGYGHVPTFNLSSLA